MQLLLHLLCAHFYFFDLSLFHVPPLFLFCLLVSLFLFPLTVPCLTGLEVELVSLSISTLLCFLGLQVPLELIYNVIRNKIIFLHAVTLWHTIDTFSIICNSKFASHRAIHSPKLELIIDPHIPNCKKWNIFKFYVENCSLCLQSDIMSQTSFPYQTYTEWILISKNSIYFQEKWFALDFAAYIERCAIFPKMSIIF